MLTIHSLEVEVEATTPMVLDSHGGSALRGAIFNALWGRFCTNHEAPTCYDCSLVEGCPVGSLVAPMRDEENTLRSHWRDVARPYIVYPPSSGKETRVHRYEPGETFTFGLTLLGTSLKLFPYIIRAFQAMEPYGFGHRLPELRGQRGRFRIREVRAYHPFTKERQLLWAPAGTPPQKPRLCVTQADITARAERLPTDGVTLEFLSPTRLTYQGQFLQHLDFSVLLLRLTERFEQVQRAYGESIERFASSEEARGAGRAQYLQMEKEARDIRLTRDETRWIVLTSHSARQQQRMSIGGLAGRASFTGHLTFGVRELLVWGEVIGVGKSVVKGDGSYRIVSEGGESQDACDHRETDGIMKL